MPYEPPYPTSLDACAVCQGCGRPKWEHRGELVGWEVRWRCPKPPPLVVPVRPPAGNGRELASE